MSAPALAPDALVPGRGCDGCTMCCKLFGIEALDKPPMQWCRHVVQGRGCGIHPERPDACRLFFCHYLRNPRLGPEWQPHRSGFVLFTEAAGKRMVVALDAGKPQAWKRAPYYAQIKHWAVLGAPRDHQILVFKGLDATAVLPDRDQPLGPVVVGDVVVYRHGPDGRIDVEVHKGAGPA